MTQHAPIAADDPLDRDYLERNYLAIGCADVLVDVVAMYLQSVPQKLAALYGALEAGQGDEFIKLAHGLKGESGSVGARQVFALASHLEQGARQGDWAACRSGMPALEEALGRVTAVLHQEFSD